MLSAKAAHMAFSVGTRKLLVKLRKCDGLMQSLIDGFQSPKCEVLVSGKDIQFAFLLWDCIAHDITLGGCEEENGLVTMVLSYDSQARRKVFSGTACTSKARQPADLTTVNRFLELMRSTPGMLKANIIFDGQMTIDLPFSLHMCFDHPIDGACLLVSNIFESNNPLTVIDQFA